MPSFGKWCRDCFSELGGTDYCSGERCLTLVYFYTTTLGKVGCEDTRVTPQ
jgi:hypothetical protein